MWRRMIRSVAVAGGARRVDVGHLADGERARAHDQGAAGDHRDRDGQDDVRGAPVPRITTTASARMMRGSERNTSMNRWSDEVQAPAEVGAGHADDGAQRGAEHGGAEAHQERRARAVERCASRRRARGRRCPASAGRSAARASRRSRWPGDRGWRGAARGPRPAPCRTMSAAAERAERPPPHELADGVEPAATPARRPRRRPRTSIRAG